LDLDPVEPHDLGNTVLVYGMAAFSLILEYPRDIIYLIALGPTISDQLLQTGILYGSLA
jgi:hypothetical protein